MVFHDFWIARVAGWAVALLCATGAQAQTAAVSAKVVSFEGAIHAVDGTGQRRPLADGGNIFPGDVVETGSGTRAVLAFRDDTRITLGEATRFRVDSFAYDRANAGEGRFLVSVLRGSVRALTGLIAKANNRNVAFSTATATIGVRGTGLDILCTGACAGLPGGAGSGLTVFNWQGSILVGLPGQAPVLLQAGQGLLVSPAGIQTLGSQPPLNIPRPDLVNVPQNLFASLGTPGPLGNFISVEGLVTVTDGAVGGTASSGGPIGNGMRIVTTSGGRAVLQLNNGCSVPLAPNQAVTVLQGMTCEELVAGVQNFATVPAGAGAVPGGSPLTGALAVTGLSLGTYGLSRTVLKNKSISGN